jgi:arylsulfatase A-like enzyme
MSIMRSLLHGLVITIGPLVGALATENQARAAEKARPTNILIVLADDLGFSDLGCYGSEIQTPNLDRLAAGGLRFTQFYNTARCWPSRAALLTGYYAQQVNRDPARRRPKWAALLPDLLKPAGYRSYHSGKWHVDGPVLQGGFQRSYLVVDQDRHFGPRNHQLDDKPLPQPKPDDGYYATTAIADHALKWLTEHDTKHRSEPFFLYLAFTCPHFPLQAPAEDVARYRDRFKDGWDVLRQRRLDRMKERGLVNCALSERTPGVPAWASLSAEQQDSWKSRMAVHAAMVDRMDREVGRVLEQLRKSGQWDNTLILFCSDNGASAERLVRGDGHDPAAAPGSAKTFLCLEPPWANLANAPLRKSKIFTHEGGICTSLIVHWPAGVKARGALRHTPGHLIDFVPTLLEVAGTAASAKWNDEERPTLPGRSLVPAFAKDGTVTRDFLFFKHEGNRALRVGDWKIVASGADAAWELYDLAKDRSETTDLAGKHPDKVKELAALWSKRDEEYRKQGATAPGKGPDK